MALTRVSYVQAGSDSSMKRRAKKTDENKINNGMRLYDRALLQLYRNLRSPHREGERMKRSTFNASGHSKFHYSKGFVEEVKWTFIVLVVALVAVVALFAVWIFFQLPFIPGKPFSYDITFVDLVNRPYLVASSAGNAKFADRILFEHALQAMVVESLENSGSERLPDLVENYMKFYNLKYYSISVKKDDMKIFEANNLPKTCEKDSFCVSKDYKTEAGTCNVGRVETKDKCGSGRACCKEDRNAYNNAPGSYAIISCGRNNIGVCSAKPELISVPGGGPEENLVVNQYISKFPCGEGRTQVEDITNSCKGINEGKTPICCAPTSVSKVSVGKAYKAEIPILYKDEQAILEVSVE